MLREWIRTIASDDFGGRKPMTEYEDWDLSGTMANVNLIWSVALSFANAEASPR